MITRSLLLASLFATGLVATADAALDLTTTAPEEYVSSGIIHQRLVFKDGNRRVEMAFPPKWSVRDSSPARLELTPSGKGFATALLQTQPAGPRDLDEAALKAFAQQALAALPGDSQGGTVESAAADPDGSGNCEVILTYKNLGYTFRRSVRFVNLPDWPLIAQISAPEAEFQALYITFRRTVQSLSWAETAASSPTTEVAAVTPLK
jgi:hypothetical protein